MSVRRWIVLGVLAAVGCGGPPAAPTASTAPLTVAEWQKLPVDQKYTPNAIERLKAANPELETPEGWDKFQKTVIAPARKKDFPNGKPR